MGWRSAFLPLPRLPWLPPPPVSVGGDRRPPRPGSQGSVPVVRRPALPLPGDPGRPARRRTLASAGGVRQNIRLAANARLIPCSASRYITASAPGGVLQRCENSSTVRSRASSFVVLYRTTQPDNAVQERSSSAKSRGDVVLVSCPAAWVMTGAFSCPGSNHCNRAVLGRDIASRTQCREETRHVLQYIDLANPQSSRRFR